MKTARQQGFTLIEIAIVLVIIGLLLGGVLKGRELIENSKVKNAANDINGVSAAFYAYQDRYKRLPGDDGPIGALTARGGLWSTPGITAGNNNGVITVTAAQTFTGAGENAPFWQHLKAAGLISGNPADTGVTALPRNAFGGLIGVTTADVMGGLLGNKLCLSQVPGKAAASLDVQFDDGNGATGNFRATEAVSGANTVPGNAVTATPPQTGYSENNVYTVCMTF
ncbi:MAG: prepilin-type N-terminal cleavage/methylation domain-containing protein [Thiomicrospira sp.]